MNDQEVKFETLKKRLHEYALARNDAKNSLKRLAVLRVLIENETHMSPDEIYRKVREKEGGGIGVSTVYRTLGFFEEAGIVKQVNIDASTKRYEIETGTHHDHLVCRKCGRVVEFYNEELENLQEQIAAQNGFELIDHEMQLYGICPECKKQSQS